MAENEIAVSGFNPVSLMPQTFNEKYQMAKILATSGLIPAGLNSPEKVCVALEWGHELQLSPMVAVNNIAVINGKPTLSADIMAAVVKRSPDYAGTEWVQLDERVAECKVMRRVNGGIETTISRFTFEDAMKAKLTGKAVWQMYPKRMLKHRCLSYALRDAFPDILAGLYNPEEMESVGDDNYTQTERNVTPPTATAGLAYEIPHETQPQVEVTTNQPPENQRTETVAETADTLNPNFVLEQSRSYLAGLVQKYRKNLSGQPYDLANQAVMSNDINQIKTMTKRVIDYLGRQGIEAA